MKTLSRNITHNFHSRRNNTHFQVEPGEEFVAETELCTGPWLHSIKDTWTEKKTTALNPTVTVRVNNSSPGDLLAIDILEIIPDKIGYTGLDPKHNPLMNLILPGEWENIAKTVEIQDGYILWDDKTRLPVKAMIGTIGTAPKNEELSNSKAGLHGGNMDVQEVCAGSTIYLPVEIKGALLHIGDVHALQGDGEINCSGGIECRATVRLRTRILPRPASYLGVRIENNEYIMTVSSEKSLEASFYAAARHMLLWLQEDWEMNAANAYGLMAQLLEARNTQFVNPTWSYICKMPKKYL
jgi:acetamidase/formamidase